VQADAHDYTTTTQMMSDYNVCASTSNPLRIPGCKNAGRFSISEDLWQPCRQSAMLAANDVSTCDKKEESCITKDVTY
jgi:hypothetical protein